VVDEGVATGSTGLGVAAADVAGSGSVVAATEATVGEVTGATRLADGESTCAIAACSGANCNVLGVASCMDIAEKYSAAAMPPRPAMIVAATNARTRWLRGAGRAACGSVADDVARSNIRGGTAARTGLPRGARALEGEWNKNASPGWVSSRRV
jgi:hypothetical protein